MLKEALERLQREEKQNNLPLFHVEQWWTWAQKTFVIVPHPPAGVADGTVKTKTKEKTIIQQSQFQTKQGEKECVLVEIATTLEEKQQNSA